MSEERSICTCKRGEKIPSMELFIYEGKQYHKLCGELYENNN